MFLSFCILYVRQARCNYCNNSKEKNTVITPLSTTATFRANAIQGAGRVSLDKRNVWHSQIYFNDIFFLPVCTRATRNGRWSIGRRENYVRWRLQYAIRAGVSRRALSESNRAILRGRGFRTFRVVTMCPYYRLNRSRYPVWWNADTVQERDINNVRNGVRRKSPGRRTTSRARSELSMRYC